MAGGTIIFKFSPRQTPLGLELPWYQTCILSYNTLFWCPASTARIASCFGNVFSFPRHFVELSHTRTSGWRPTCKTQYRTGRWLKDPSGRECNTTRLETGENVKQGQYSRLEWKETGKWVRAGFSIWQRVYCTFRDEVSLNACFSVYMSGFLGAHLFSFNTV